MKLPITGNLLFFIVLSLLTLIAATAAAALGPVAVSPLQVLQIVLSKAGLMGGDFTPLQEAVVWSIRLPRICLALLVGGSLALAGAALQGLFRNPLADPSLIGISSGGAVGAALSVALAPLLGLGLYWATPLMAMLGGLLATILIYQLARVDGHTRVSALLLAGLAVNTLSAAVVGFCLFLASVNERNEFIFWMLGSLHRSNWDTLAISGPFIVVALLGLPCFARALNALLLGESDAYHLGFAPERVRRWIIVLSASCVGAGVAVCGIIGFIGLIVPHMVRLIAGPDHRALLPASALAGGCLLVVADTAARLLVQPAELPIGILTALVGAPFFLFLLRQRKFGEALS